MVPGGHPEISSPHLAGLVSTCQTSGQAASNHLANSRPDILPFFDVQTWITVILQSLLLIT